MAATTKFTNNAISKLAGSLTNVATSFSCTATEGAKFPVLTGANWFMMTLIKIVAGVAQYEVVKVTARSADVFTVVRAQEGTTALTFSAGDVIEHRLTAGTTDEFVKKGDDNTISGNTTFSGLVTMNGKSIIETEGSAVASAATTNIWATDGNTVHVTGTTTINSFGTAPQAGAWMKVIFDGTLTLTQSANLNLNNNGSNVTVAADDLALVYADTTTQLDVFVIRKNGMPVANIAPSSFTLLATLTPSGSSNVLEALSVFSSTYDQYAIVLDGIKSSADDALLFRFANGGAVDTGSKYYETNVGGVADTTAGASVTVQAADITSTGKGLNANLMVLNANDTVNAKVLMGQVALHAGGPSFSTKQIAGSYDSANAASGIRFYWATGTTNFSATGKIRIYGISNT